MCRLAGSLGHCHGGPSGSFSAEEPPKVSGRQRPTPCADARALTELLGMAGKASQMRPPSTCPLNLTPATRRCRPHVTSPDDGSLAPRKSIVSESTGTAATASCLAAALTLRSPFDAAVARLLGARQRVKRNISHAVWTHHVLIA